MSDSEITVEDRLPDGIQVVYMWAGWKAARVFDLPSHVRLSEWLTVLVLAAASEGAAVRFSTVYSRELYGGIVALLLAVNAVLVWAAFRNNSIRRRRALSSEFMTDSRE